jgi:hypothetical protein
MTRRLILGVALLLSVVAAGSPLAATMSSAHAAPVAAHVSSPAQAPAAERAQFLDTVRVIAHLALAYGVFHHWVYKPWKAGQIGLNHKANLVKAGLALLFAVHEVKKAYAITKTAKSGPLHALNGVLASVTDQFTKVGNVFKNPSNLTDAQVGSQISNLNNLVNQSNKIVNAPDAPSVPSKF